MEAATNAAAATVAAITATSVAQSNVTRYVLVAIAILLILLVIYQFVSSKDKKEGYNKNRTTRDDPQGDWSLVDRIKKINLLQDK